MRFSSEPIEEHQEVPLADDGEWERLVDHWKSREQGPKVRDARGNRCYVVCVVHPEDAYPQGKQEEILGLVKAQGDQVVGVEVQKLRKPEPRTYLGKGMSMEIAARARESGADLLVLDAALSPSQMRNLEDQTGLPICDREGVILNVFLVHARTRAARMQVEIAHLEYLRPRIRGLGLNMDQQAGGIMGSRGPGETASELMARRLDRRLADLRKALQKQEMHSANQRKHRNTCERIALVGYTNAGKTSLMNALTAAGGSVRDQPFETLDTTTRCLTRHGGEILLSDTVGFIRALPQRLFASFASTLSELVEASLLAIVVDSTDPEWELHLETTTTMLQELHAAHLPRFYIFNKIDRCQRAEPQTDAFARAAGEHPFAVLSAHREEDVNVLKQRLIQAVRKDARVEIFIPYEASSAMSRVYASCRILKSQPEETGIHFSLEGPQMVLAQISAALEQNDAFEASNQSKGAK